MSTTSKARALKAIGAAGLIRPRDLEAVGVARWMLYELVKDKSVTQIGRGLYRASNFEPTEFHSYAEVQKQVPHGVICLLSALRFHQLTDQNPHEVWIAIPKSAWRPKPKGTSVKLLRFSGDSLKAGVGKHQVEGVEIHVTNAARTIADCFKYRNKIGIDLAIQALREGVKRKLFSMDELWRYAKLTRMTRIIMPYLEAVQI